MSEINCMVRVINDKKVPLAKPEAGGVMKGCIRW